MAAKAKTTKKRQEQQNVKGLSDTQRWIYGMILFVFAVFLLVAVVSYYFYWPVDQNFVNWGDMGRSNTAPVANPTGKIGAVLASYMVGKWFGVFGVIIPIILIIFAFRIINYRPAFLRKSVRLSLIIMILGSVSLGYLFGTRWDIFGTGLGGAHGIFISRWLSDMTGIAGTGLILLLFWILLAVYINRKTIGVVNRVGKGILEGSVKVGEAVATQATELMHRKDETQANSSSPEEPAPKEDSTAITPEYTSSPDNSSFPKTGSDIPISANDKGDTLPEPDSRNIDTACAKSFHETDFAGDIQATTDETVKVYNAAFEIDDRRNTATDPSEIFVVDRGENARPRVDSSPRVVTLGEEAGEYIYDSRAGAGGSMRETEKVFAGSVGEFAEIPKSAEITDNTFAVTQTVDIPDENFILANPPFTGTSSSGLEVVGPKTETKLSVGGVVEVSSPNGVKADAAMEVVVAEYKDTVLDDDQIDEALYDPTRELSKYQKPPVELLEDHSVDVQVTEEEIYENKNQIVRTLENFGIKIDKIKATIGPTVTLYEIVPAAGVKISKIKNLEDDIALSLKALGIRIIAPMPGKGTVGIEVPNKDKEVVSMYSVVKTMKFQESGYELPIVLGKTISNETFMIDLAKMPHLLVAGATGQGKSVGLNAIITSLLYKKHPAELKFVLVDPKRVELSLYSKLERHFLAKMASEEEAILTDTQRVVYTLNSLCQEMSDRYDLLRMGEVKKLSEYNEKFVNRKLNPKKGHRFLPYIVVVVDEFADMIMTAGREVEAPITRLAQLARAVGIHLVIATQRPDVKVITGLIKANFPARIAFRVMSMVDSRTIIDQPGANQLIGRGDMLMSLNGESTRVQCAFIDTPEIERITEFISNQRGYSGAYELPDYTPDVDTSSESRGEAGPKDAMFEEVARFVVQNQQGSTSSIQRRFAIGYNRAGRIMDQLEDAGIVGRAEGSKPREVLIIDINSLEHILGNLQR